jgi:hypothetical protein
MGRGCTVRRWRRRQRRRLPRAPTHVPDTCAAGGGVASRSLQRRRIIGAPLFDAGPSASGAALGRAVPRLIARIPEAAARRMPRRILLQRRRSERGMCGARADAAELRADHPAPLGPTLTPSIAAVEPKEETHDDAAEQQQVQAEADTRGLHAPRGAVQRKHRSSIKSEGAGARARCARRAQGSSDGPTLAAPLEQLLRDARTSPPRQKRRSRAR